MQITRARSGLRERSSAVKEGSRENGYRCRVDARLHGREMSSSLQVAFWKSAIEDQKRRMLEV